MLQRSSSLKWFTVTDGMQIWYILAILNGMVFVNTLSEAFLYHTEDFVVFLFFLNVCNTLKKDNGMLD